MGLQEEVIFEGRGYVPIDDSPRSAIGTPIGIGTTPREESNVVSLPDDDYRDFWINFKFDTSL